MNKMLRLLKIKDNTWRSESLSWFVHVQNKHTHVKQCPCLDMDIFPKMSHISSGCSALKQLIMIHITIQKLALLLIFASLVT